MTTCRLICLRKVDAIYGRISHRTPCCEPTFWAIASRHPMSGLRLIDSLQKYWSRTEGLFRNVRVSSRSYMATRRVV